MKNKIQFKSVLAVLLMALISVSCIHENFDEPPTSRTYDFNSNTTISELKALYDQSRDTNQIVTDVIIKATVISSDETGNFYKKLVLQDSTGGIEFQIDQSDIYVQYPVGSELLVKCKGLFLGTYGRVIQLGSSLLNGSVQRIPAPLVSEYFFITGKKNNITPDTVTIADLADANYVNTLVAIKGVQFAEGQAGFATYADAVAKTTQNRTIVENASGKTIILRNSGFASFAGDTLPTKSGTIVAVFSVFNSDKQLFIRDLNDVMFDKERGAVDGGGGGETPKGTGTKADPYNVAKAIQSNSGTFWVDGYIVGCVNDISISTAVFAPPFSKNSNLLIADKADEKKIANCLVIQLPVGDIRNVVNLMDNGGNLGKRIQLKGSLETYFGVPGMKSTSGYWMDGAGIDPDAVVPGQLFNEKFLADLGQFKAFSVAGNNAWVYNSFDAGNAKMSGFNDAANEDWLVSPVINVAGQTTLKLVVRQAVNYLTTWDDLKVLVSTDYDGTSSPNTQGTWNAVTINTKPAGNNWDFVNSEDIDIAAYAGGNLYIAFKYVNASSASASTWEISEVSVKNN